MSPDPTDSRLRQKDLRQSDRVQKIYAKGTVREVLPGALYRVDLHGGETVVAHVSSELRMYVVRVLPGDSVTLEISEYDMSRGRIVRVGRS